MQTNRAEPFLGRWFGAQYVKGTHADGRPHFEAPVPHTITIERDEGGVFLGTPFGRIPLFVLGPTAANIEAVEIAGASRAGRPVVFRVSSGTVYRIGDVLAFSCAATIKHEDGETLTVFFVFQGERVEERALARADLH